MSCKTLNEEALYAVPFIRYKTNSRHKRFIEYYATSNQLPNLAPLVQNTQSSQSTSQASLGT